MLYKLSASDVDDLQMACVMMRIRAIEFAEAAERILHEPDTPEGLQNTAKIDIQFNLALAAKYEAVYNALAYDREITTLAQVKEALED